MEMPCLYEDSLRTETKIFPQVGDLKLEGNLISMKTCKGVLEMRKGRELKKGL